MSDETYECGSWRNAAERAEVERQMNAKGYFLTSTYGGIGTFGGREVGIFLYDKDRAAVQNFVKCLIENAGV